MKIKGEKMKHDKPFQKWCGKKIIIHKEKERPSFRIGEVWTNSLGVNIGFEQDGVGDESLRPILILTKFNNEVFLGVPLSRNGKDGKFYYSFEFNDGLSTVLLSQVRLIDAKRLQYKLGAVAPSTREIVVEKVRRLIR